MLCETSNGCVKPFRLLLLRAAKRLLFTALCPHPCPCCGLYSSHLRSLLLVFFFLGAEAMAKVPDRSRHKWSALHTFLRCNMNPETQRVVVFVILLFLIIVNVVLMFLLAFH